MSSPQRRSLSVSNPFRKSSASSASTASSSGSNGPQLKPFSPRPSTLDAPESTASSSSAASKMSARGSQDASGASSKKAASKAAGRSVGDSSSASAEPSSSQLAARRHMRRDSSLTEKGAAVLRAMKRAPEDETPDHSPSGSPTTRNGDTDGATDISAAPLPLPKANGGPKSPLSDDGYDPEAVASPGRRPKPFAFTALDAAGEDGGTTGDVSRAGSFVGLSEAEKAIGRKNREGLRRRAEQNQVEKMVGPPKTKREPKKKAKSWEIPRKIFHSSIGKCKPCGHHVRYHSREQLF